MNGWNALHSGFFLVQLAVWIGITRRALRSPKPTGWAPEPEQD